MDRNVPVGGERRWLPAFSAWYLQLDCGWPHLPSPPPPPTPFLPFHNTWRSEENRQWKPWILMGLRKGNRRMGQEKNVCFVCWLLNVQQHASVSQGRICTDNFTCCHTEIEAADQTFHLTQSQYTDTGPNSHSADPITPDAWQGSHWSANF